MDADLTAQERRAIEAHAKAAQILLETLRDEDDEMYQQDLADIDLHRQAASHEWPGELRVRRWLKSEAHSFGGADFSHFELYHHRATGLLFGAFRESDYARSVAKIREVGVFLARGGMAMMRYNYYVLCYMAGAYWRENRELGPNVGAEMGSTIESAWDGLGGWVK